MLELALKEIFGLRAKVDFGKWGFENQKLKIIDIDWHEDLLTDPEASEEPPSTRLNIILWRR